MPRRGIRRMYDSLRPEELFRLVVAATARGDDREREALLESCPRVALRVRHPAFEAALEGTRALLDLAVPNLARYLGWLEALEAIRAPIHEAVALLVGAPTPAPSEPGPFVCQEVARTHTLRCLGALLSAFGDTCADHGLDSGEVLRAFAPAVADALASRREEIHAAGSAPDAQEGFRSLLVQAWADTLP